MTERAYEKIISFVEKQIMEGKYTIGDKLPPERELAQMLGASRNSVREGLGILERMGAISSLQGAGNFISGNFEGTLIEVMGLMFMLEKASFKEIAEFRYALEAQALQLAMDRITDEEIRELEEYVRLLDLVPGEDEKAHYDKCIHYTIASASRNRYIIDNLQALTVVMDTFIKDMRSKILSDHENKDGLMKSHADMVVALKEKNREKAMNAMDVHFSYIYDYLDR